MEQVATKTPPNRHINKLKKMPQATKERTQLLNQIKSKYPTAASRSKLFPGKKWQNATNEQLRQLLGVKASSKSKPKGARFNQQDLAKRVSSLAKETSKELGGKKAILLKIKESVAKVKETAAKEGRKPTKLELRKAAIAALKKAKKEKGYDRDLGRAFGWDDSPSLLQSEIDRTKSAAKDKASKQSKGKLSQMVEAEAKQKGVGKKTMGDRIRETADRLKEETGVQVKATGKILDAAAKLAKNNDRLVNEVVDMVSEDLNKKEFDRGASIRKASFTGVQPKKENSDTNDEIKDYLQEAAEKKDARSLSSVVNRVNELIEAKMFGGKKSSKWEHPLSKAIAQIDDSDDLISLHQIMRYAHTLRGEAFVGQKIS